MAKRFADTKMYGKGWFRKLPTKIKCLWEWLRCNCDHAGVLDFDPALASFQIGEEVTWDCLAHFGDRVIRFKGDKIFLKDFIPFQYGELNVKNNAHRSVIAILKKYDLMKFLGAGQPLMSPSQGAQDKDKAQDKEKDKDKDQDQEEENGDSSSTQGEDNSGASETEKILIFEIQNAWNEIFHGDILAKKIYPARHVAGMHLKNLITTWGYLGSVEAFRELFLEAKRSDYLMGRIKGRDSPLSFTWITNYDNTQKVLDGTYARKAEKPDNEIDWSQIGDEAS